jgi:hypothetical protein
VFYEKRNSKHHVKLMLELSVTDLIQERECVEKFTFRAINQRKYVKRIYKYLKIRAVFYFQGHFRKLLKK